MIITSWVVKDLTFPKERSVRVFSYWAVSL